MSRPVISKEEAWQRFHRDIRYLEPTRDHIGGMELRNRLIADGRLKSAGPTGLTTAELGKRGFIHAAYLGGFNRRE